MKNPLPIGTAITFSKGYDKTCCRRFVCSDYKEKPNTYVLTPSISQGQGFIVGMRTVIMSEYQFYPCHTSWEGVTDGSAYSSGKREQVYLVAKNHTSAPFLVRKTDILSQGYAPSPTN